ncbi:MAG TPA: alanine:cation symporter family protein, partial [Daejeonella sp.]|nr:alanine:cation symporter family protein [Daejeonella sp.]
AYYYIAETNLSYLDKKGSKWALWALRLLLLISAFYGTIKTAESAWTLGDIGVGIMAWLNVIAIILLRKPALLALKDYQTQRKQGSEEPVFDAKALGIKNTEVWE